MYLLYGLIQPYPFQTVVDYGCGAGTMVKWLKNITEKVNVVGYDIENHTNDNPAIRPSWFIDYKNDIPVCNTLYFFHSFAHIDKIDRVLYDLREKVKERVIVITPNEQWLRMQDDEKYIPDPTVKKHYTHDELYETFENCGYKVQLSGGFGVRQNNQHERLFLVAKP